MKNTTIHIRQSLFIRRPPETVWDFTQDYAVRGTWDPSVLHAEVLETVPKRLVRLKMKGRTVAVFQYKLDERPRRTTLAIIEIQSPIFLGGGGSWQYEAQDGGTLWTQSNTLVLKPLPWLVLLQPLLKWVFGWQARLTMQRAKRRLESSC